MDDQQRRDDGMGKRRKVLGNAWVDKSQQNRNAFNADNRRYLTAKLKRAGHRLDHLVAALSETGKAESDRP